MISELMPPADGSSMLSPSAVSGGRRRLGLPSAGGFLRQYELVERVLAYQSDADEDALNRAYVFAMVKHGTQKRHSGDPYFAHPVAVAGLLTELRLDEHTIITGLLHDTVEDTGVSLEEIRDAFGEKVADLVDGVTKLPRLSRQSRRSGQAENFQKFILAMARDIRVLLVKLADRLHNMRTLRFIPEEARRKRVARETLEIYAPLAHRTGLSVMAEEFEDLSFSALDPDTYAMIDAHLAACMNKSENAVAAICSDIEKAMAGRNVDVTVSGRLKRPYSVWRKLERKSIEFGEIGDVLAFRLIAPDVNACYRALGVAHRSWPAVAGMFKDYISVPKRNGYQSLHTMVSGLHGGRVEMQIRTPQMDAVAERGVAAHWRYKNASYGFDQDGARAFGLDVEADLTALADMLAHGSPPEEFLEHAKLELYRDSVFVSTPKGRLVKLPSGATPVDFAYAIHTRIGDTCVGARINGVEKPLPTALRNGDVVEILRRRNAVPPPHWDEMVVTGRAKSALQRLIRARRRKEKTRLGRLLLEREMETVGIGAADIDLKNAVRRAGYASVRGLIHAVADGRLTAGAALQAAFPGLAMENPEQKTQQRLLPAAMPVIGEDLTVGVSVFPAKCCWPIPGDRIVGILAADKGIDVHIGDCPHLQSLNIAPERLVDLNWKEAAGQGRVAARIIVSTVDEPGAMAEIFRIVESAKGNIVDVQIVRRSPTHADQQFDIEIPNVRDLTGILNGLRLLDIVVSAERVADVQAMAEPS